MRPLFVCIIACLPLSLLGQFPVVETELCERVERKQWSGIGPEIGKFLDSLNYEGDGRKQGRQRRMNNLKAWLESHDCVKSAEVKADLIKERPPQKGVLVTFLLNGHEKAMMLRIIMDMPYRFGGIRPH